MKNSGLVSMMLPAVRFVRSVRLALVQLLLMPVLVPVIHFAGFARHLFQTGVGYCRLRSGRFCVSGVYSFHLLDKRETFSDFTIEPLTVHRTLPVGVEDLPPRIRKLFTRETSYLFSKGGLVTPKGPCLLAKPYAIILDNGKIFKEPSQQFSKSIFEHPTIARKKLEIDVKVSNGWAAFAHGDLNYYHWLVDLLPLLLLPNYREQIHRERPTLILPRFDYAFQKESFALLELPECEIVNTPNKSNVVRIDRLNVPVLPRATNQAHPNVVQALRDQFLPNVENSLSKRRIYLTRMGSKRCITNEEEIRHLLERYDISTVRLEDMSFHMQVQLFSNAELVIAPHGAGAANIIFLPEGASVIELFSPNYVVPCYWRIANVRKCNYAILLGKPYRSFEPGSESYMVNPRELECLIKRVIAISKR